MIMIIFHCYIYRNVTYMGPVLRREDWIRFFRLRLRVRGATKDTKILKDLDEGRETDGFRGGAVDFSSLSLAGCNQVLDSIPYG